MSDFCPTCGQPFPSRWAVKVVGQTLADFEHQMTAQYYADGLRLDGQTGVSVEPVNQPKRRVEVV